MTQNTTLDSNIIFRAATLSYPGKDLEAMDFAQNYHNWILDKFEPFVGNSLLEVGAGSGSLTKLLFQRFLNENPNKTLIATEPSGEMFQALNQNLTALKTTQIKSYNNFLTEKIAELQNQKIDTAIYINVLEHIEKDVAELTNVNQVLQPGGRILTFSPALPFLMSDFDRSIGHFRRYTLDEMKSKMLQAGFKILEAYYMDMPGIIPWYLAFTLLKKQLSSGNAATYDKYVVPVLKVLEPSKILPFGKNILVIGEKS